MARVAGLFGAEVIVQQVVPLARLGPRLAVERGKPDVEHYARDLAVVLGGAGLDIAPIVRHAECPVPVA